MSEPTVPEHRPTAPEQRLAGLDPAAIDAVVFDIGGVFTIRLTEPIRAGLEPAGFPFADDEDLFHEAHHRGVRSLSDALLAAGDSPIVEASKEFWLNYERGYFAHLGVAPDDLGRALDVFAAHAKTLPVGSVWRRVLADNVVAFGRIAAALPVAIVSNNDGTAEQQLLELGICQVGEGPLPSVAIVVDSGTIGIAKPDPAIFLPALAALGTDPARTLYVGDTVHADVHGARAAGMPVVQLDPYDLHADFDHHRLPDVAALADLLLGPAD